MSVLRVTNLRATLPGGFTLDIPRWSAAGGKLHALVGCNGAGKSTLLRALTGEVAATAGCVSLHGVALQDWAANTRARHLAILPQASHLSFGFKAREVVALGLTPLTLGWRLAEREIRRVMTLTNCVDLAERPYPRLSGGQQQRVHLARVLLQLSQAEHVPVLLLDEPTSAQDIGQQHRLLTLAQQLCEERGYAVVAVLHDLNHALRYAHQASLLHAGALVDSDCTGKLITPATITRFWGYEPRIARDPAGHLVVA